MAGDEDRPGFLDREKKSFSELDRLRRERRDGRDPALRDPAAQRRSEAAASQYRKQLDALFAEPGQTPRTEQLARAVIDARGTPGLAGACRAYLDAAGPPREARVLHCFLEAETPEIALAGLEAVRALHDRGELESGPGLRTQLRLLAESPDDVVADSAEELLERL